MTTGSVGGGCLCGAVRWRIALPPKWVAHCHCSMCRRAHGAGFVTWVGVSREAFTLERGDSELVRYRSSRQATRGFCGRCGSTLLFESGHWPGEIHVTLANLDSAEGLEPQVHAYWASRAPWAIAGEGDSLAKIDPPEHGEESG